MKQSELTQELDHFFDVEHYNERDMWLEILYADTAKRDAAHPFFAPEFWDGNWNGLMLDNAEEIERVYLVVFPTGNIIDTIIAKEVGRGGSGAMIFAHHPAAYDETERGFISIPVEQLEELQEHQISYYSCHAPLDCHTEISTANALANGLGLNDLQRFAPYYGGQAGVIGSIPEISFQELAERLMEVCELPHLRYDQILHNAQPIKKVAIVAGGGGTETIFMEAQQLGVDTFVTGHWHLFGRFEFAGTRRKEFESMIPKLKMNVLGASHYSSEMVVMRDQMVAFFDDRFDLEATLIRQEKPWRAS